MEYGLISKKIAILCAPGNTLWRSLYPDQDITVSRDCKKVLGCSFQTLMNWIKGQPPRKELLSRLCETINAHDASDISIALNMFEDECSVYEFGETLGLTRTECERAIDERVYHNTPLLPGFYLSKEDASIYYSEYNGVYFSYHFSRSHDGEIWLARSALRVLYVLKISSYHTLRCKLHIPSLDDGHFFEYNGFLSVRGNHLYWLFEERQTSRKDFLSIMTSRGHSDNRRELNLNGLYTTLSQTTLQMPCSSRILCKRVAQASEWSEEQIHDHMNDGPRALRDMSQIEDEIRKYLGDPQVFFSMDTAEDSMSDAVDNLLWDVTAP